MGGYDAWIKKIMLTFTHSLFFFVAVVVIFIVAAGGDFYCVFGLPRIL